MALILSASPAQAQLARMRASLGIAPVVVAPQSSVAVRPVSMREALARSIEHQAQADGMRGAILEAQKAAVAALRSSTLPVVKDGMTGANGANPDAGLDPVRTGVFAALDPTGVNTWQGAKLPTQVDKDGKPLVTIIQTDERAILSWNRFDVGANTTLNFEQRVNGVAQPGWVALNRVGNAVAPSRILGSITADGTVAVINSRGVIFEKGSQVNLHSLLVSSLEIGNFAAITGSKAPRSTISIRNATFLQSGLQTAAIGTTGSQVVAPQLTSSLLSSDIFVTKEGDIAPTAIAQAFQETPVEGAVTIDRGAAITASGGGFIVVTAPNISNAGSLSAAEGQVSLQAGRSIAYGVSTGSATTTDVSTGIGPDVRGLVLRSWYGLNGTVTNAGLIDVPRGYISLGSGERGIVTNSGLLASTTSVARNAKISLTGGTILLAGNAAKTLASGIVVTPDTNGETVPIGTADTPPAFKSTKIEIGNVYLSRGVRDNNGVIGRSSFGPAGVVFGTNSVLLAPNADLVVGGTYVDPGGTDEIYEPPSLGNIDVAAEAIIDVSGVKDLQIDAARNSLAIDPLKRNELRDTPNYREVTTNGDFTLNGATVYVDPRLSDVRADGVAWVGSPLIEAGSAASQIGVTAAELMTRSGNISMTVAVVDTQGAAGGDVFVSALKAPTINIAKGAVIDFSGGWVHYGDGFVRSSKLLTADGRIVDISKADPNDDFIAVGDGFTEVQSKYGISRTFANSLLQGGRLEVGYDEGRDAGALSLTSSALNLEGTLYGNAFTGGRQAASALRSTRASSIASDSRSLQATALQLPASGGLNISSGYPAGIARLGADILIYHGDRATVARPYSEILLSDSALSGVGLSGLSLFSTGRVSFAADSSVTIANGGALSILAGRTITLDGKISAPSGTITARTSPNEFGSGFRSDDDLSKPFLKAGDILNPYDINVGGTLSVAGLWANDFGKVSGETTGAGFGNGGSVSLTTAADVQIGFGPKPIESSDYVADLSGSIIIADAASIDVSSGGYVAPDGTFKLTAKGGNISLINRTTYASSDSAIFDESGRIIAQTVAVTPSTFILPSTLPSKVILQPTPINPDAEVSFSASSLKGFGFGGGGAFTLVAPTIAMGSDVAPNARGVGLDFLQKTGFGTLDLSANRSKIVQNLFRGVTGNSAFLDTTLFRIAAGQTLDLTQSIRSPFVDQATAARLAAVATGGDISFLTPAIPDDRYDRLAATLRLGGMTELDIASGGAITGAAGAKLIVSKLLNEGTIKIAGGAILQQFSREQAALAKRTGFGVRDVSLGGMGLGEILGGGTGDGPYNENDLTRAVLYKDFAGTRRISNGDLFRTPYFDRNVYFLGRLDSDEGIRLAAGSVTDLSGTALVNPRAPVLPSGVRQVTGRVVAGGTIESGPTIRTQPQSSSPFTAFTNFAQKLNALPGAVIDLRGASASFDEAVTQSTYAKLPQWSNGGRLSLLSGGSLGGSTIKASGGAAQAEGGVLEWLNPVIRQNDTGVRADNVMFGSQIDKAHAGFDTIVAYNGFTADGVGGNVDLTLGKAFVVEAFSNAPMSVAGGTSFSVNAPYVSLQQTRRVIISDDRKPVVLAGSAPGTLTFNASRNIDLVGQLTFLLPLASVDPKAPRSSVNFVSGGDIRLVGLEVINPASLNAPSSLNGGISANGDIRFSAAQVYATTGTGNLQQTIEDRQAGRNVSPSPFDISSSDANGTISFLAKSGATASNVYSAGSYVRVRAAKIIQGGVLRAPLGLLELGSNVADLAAPATQSLTFAAGSTTSVSGIGKLVPYGTTTDLTDYLFAANTPRSLTAPPVGQLTLSGDKIIVAEGATIDGRGGGDVFAYEFVSGTGGSRDVLDRFNADVFSGNAGLQYADGRQVYAILPKDRADLIAKYDPVYSVGYADGAAGSLYGQSAGRSVILDASPGLAAGEYILLPAHYALLPDLGALRVVENVGAAVPTPGTASTLLDGSIVVGGVYGTAGTGLADSTRRSFTLQTQTVFKKSSRLETTFATATLVKRAEKTGTAVPRLPIDAARVILSPITELKVAGLLNTSAPAGRGAQFDIGGSKIKITGAAGTATDPIIQTSGFLTLSTATLAGLNASSLFVGGERTDNNDGTTTLGVLADEIDVDAKVRLSTPELILAVAGQASSLTVNDGAVLTATGNSGDRRTGDYIITSSATAIEGNVFDQSGIGSVLRLAGGDERLVQRQGDFALRNTLKPSELEIGAATLNGTSLALDTSRTFTISDKANFNVTNIAISADVLQFGSKFIESNVEAALAKATRLTLRSPDVIRFSATSPHIFNDLRLDAPGLALVAPTGAAAKSPSALAITAKHLVIGNSAADLGACTAAGVRACGKVGNTVLLSATDVTFSSGQFRTYGFDKSVTLNAGSGMFVEGAGGFAVTSDTASLAFNTPFLIDRANTADLRNAYVRPDYEILTDGAFTITAPVVAVATPAAMEAPGARIAIGSVDAPVASATIDGALVRATSGIVDVRANGAVTVKGNAVLSTPGFARTFGDGSDTVTVSANGGTINLFSKTGSIDTASTASLIVDNGSGDAGTLNLVATRGTVNFSAALNPGLAAGTVRTASLTIDAQRLLRGATPFDFASFVTRNGSQFGGDIAIRTGTGNLALNAGQTVRARSVLLTADDTALGQGSITIAGTIDTSGDDLSALQLSDPAYNAARINGGNISLYGNGGVTLAATGTLRATTAGYSPLDSRVASGGDVILGVGRVSTVADPVAVTLATGSRIDVGALRSGYRLVSQISKDPVTLAEVTAFRYAEADKGGVVTLRVPISPGNKIDIRNNGTISGVRSLEIEAFKRFDLQAIAKLGTFTGISADGVHLDATATGAKPNFFATLAPGTLPDFVRNFGVTSANGQALGAFKVRPGIELDSTSDIVLDSILNLGAGRITNYAAAEAAGLLEKSPLGPDLTGNPRYQLVANAEGHAFENETRLFNQFVDMTYRVGGSVAGAAPVVTLRAAGDLNVKNSITDGFFAFHDRSNADYISYQLGGGDRNYHPALALACGASTEACANGASYTAVVNGTYVDPITGRPIPSLRHEIRITIGKAIQGEDVAPFTHSPYTASVNAVGASGTGDPLGVAELFPLVNGKPASSSTIRLVGGSGALSVNPLHTDIAAPGTVSVSGEHSYDIEKTNGSLGLSGLLQLRVPNVGGVKPELFDIGSFFTENFGEDAERAKDFYTVLTWGNNTPIATDARASAVKYFAGATFTGPVNARTGVNARLGDIVAFLAGPNFAGKTYAQNVENGKPGYDSVNLTRVAGPNLSFDGKVIYTSTTVRTGDGSVALAAGGDVNLLRGERVVYRTETGSTSIFAGVKSAVVGSNAVYTAGVRSDLSLPAGVILPAAANEPIDYTPIRFRNGTIDRIASGVQPIAPVFANNGGKLSIVASGSIIGRRDVWGELYAPVWRAGQVGFDTTLTSDPEYFTSGIATLAGGDVSIRAGRTVNDLSIYLANNVFTKDFNKSRTLFTLGSGNLALNVGTDLLGSRISIASGIGNAKIGGSVIAGGLASRFDSNGVTVNYDKRNLLNLRLNDAALTIATTGGIDIGGVSAFGAGYTSLTNDLGFYTPISGLTITSDETINIVSNEIAQRDTLSGANAPDRLNNIILPGSLKLNALYGDIRLGTPFFDIGRIGLTLNEDYLLFPSAVGQLSLIAGGKIENLALAMLDADPADLPGALSSFDPGSRSTGSTPPLKGLDFAFPIDGQGDVVARLAHNRRPTHLGDVVPAQIYAGGSINNIYLSIPKQANIGAGGDIVDLAFRGQNLNPSDVTRITAGGDITTTRAVTEALGRAFNSGNDIEVGGPGALFVEAGRDLGPFLASGNGKSGGIRTVGNDANPWLSAQGASIYAMFGLKSPTTGAANGANYVALRDTYLNPANLAKLDGDLFEQITDLNGNKTPDRTRYIYAPILAQWLYDNEPALFAKIFAGGDVGSAAKIADGTTLAEATRLAVDTSLDAAARAAAAAKLSAATTLATAAYPKLTELYAAFTSLGSDAKRVSLRQEQFLLDRVYFGELAAPADPAGTSYLQYVRAYRAAQTLFPADRGYTDNLSTYDLDPATINADHPIGVPTKKVDTTGEPLVAPRVRTGNVDLRLSAIQTTRGGDISLIGPGGDIIAGSVVRLESQLARTAQGAVPNPFIAGQGATIQTFPIGNEGVLTLRGGGIRSFTDGDFRLNQSRLFAVRGGDLVLFSSNGDLNAGQGPKTASSFPPVTQRCDLNFFCEVDSAGSVAGAGIATFKPSPEIKASSVTLIAPVGTVDAGDAGVRASGNVFVAAARVANADNFKVGGSAFGVPSLGVTAAAVPAGAANAINANTFRPTTLTEKINDRLSQILVNVLGFIGGNNPCPDGEVQDANGKCLPK